MKDAKLTVDMRPATPLRNSGRDWGSAMAAGQSRLKVLCCSALIIFMSGCISVAAPDEPIVIELNINIRQEVIYRLAEDAANTIEENADIF